MLRNVSNIASPTPHARPRLPDRGFAVTAMQASLLAALLAGGFTLLLTTVETALGSTLLTFLFVTLAGLWLSDHTRYTLRDPKLKILGTFWILKLMVTLVLLYAGWIPQLDPGSASWGYDPQRYFQDSWDTIENDWVSAANVKYQGVIYYYAAIFYVLGHNPVIPALINTLVTLLGTLFLIRCAYIFAPHPTPKDWRIAALILVPEVLWYDVMTSRETLMATLIIVSALAAGRYMVGVGRTSLTNTLLLSGSTLVAVLAVRTTMGISVALSIALMALVLRSRSKAGPLVKLLLVALGVAAVAMGPIIQQLTGGYEFDYYETLNQIQSLESNIAADWAWSGSSIGVLIAPNNAWQAVVFLPPRMLMYLAAPLPNVSFEITELLGGSWIAWQNLATLPTSVLMLLGFPYVLAGTAHAWRHRKQLPAPLIIPFTFWINFAAVAGGNIIIHERYRLMFTLLLFACMWSGYTRCRRTDVIRWALPWFGLLAFAAIFYAGYKFT